MGCCSGRCLMFTLCALQMISILERQVFDFLGYMWTPIIVNFIQIVFIIVGFFGVLQYRPKIVFFYTIWCLIWMGWNIFIICFYLQVGVLKRSSSILNMGTSNKSWWLENGIGCTISRNFSSSTSPGLIDRTLLKESDVSGCLIDYHYVEVIHAGIQCVLSLFGFCASSYVIYIFNEEDDSSAWESQPVRDELEYIKMRYKSPARKSFRGGASGLSPPSPATRTYENLQSAYSTVDRSDTAPPGGVAKSARVAAMTSADSGDDSTLDSGISLRRHGNQEPYSVGRDARAPSSPEHSTSTFSASPMSFHHVSGQHGTTQPIQQHSAAPIQQHGAAPIQQHNAAPIQQHSAAPNQQHSVAPIQQHGAAPIQQHSAAPIQQQAAAPIQQHAAAPIQQLHSTSPMHPHSAVPTTQQAVNGAFQNSLGFQPISIGQSAGSSGHLTESRGHLPESGGQLTGSEGHLAGSGEHLNGSGGLHTVVETTPRCVGASFV